MTERFEVIAPGFEGTFADLLRSRQIGMHSGDLVCPEQVMPDEEGRVRPTGPGGLRVKASKAFLAQLARLLCPGLEAAVRASYGVRRPEFVPRAFRSVMRTLADLARESFDERLGGRYRLIWELPRSFVWCLQPTGDRDRAGSWFVSALSELQEQLAAPEAGPALRAIGARLEPPRVVFRYRLDEHGVPFLESDTPFSVEAEYELSYRAPQTFFRVRALGYIMRGNRREATWRLGERRYRLPPHPNRRDAAQVTQWVAARCLQMARIYPTMRTYCRAPLGRKPHPGSEDWERLREFFGPIGRAVTALQAGLWPGREEGASVWDLILQAVWWADGHLPRSAIDSFWDQLSGLEAFFPPTLIGIDDDGFDSGLGLDFRSPA